jgi:hypothetical protein
MPRFWRPGSKGPCAFIRSLRCPYFYELMVMMFSVNVRSEKIDVFEVLMT